MPSYITETDYLNEQHKKPIEDAISSCNQVYNVIRENILNSFSDKEFAVDLFNIIYNNTYIAGGFIRDSLLGKKPNDIDIWFVDEHSLVDFQHKLLSSEEQNKFIQRITDRNSFILKKKYQDVPISFVTLETNKPLDMIHKSFDISINSHFVFPGDETYCFNLDTLKKIGGVLLEGKESSISVSELSSLLHRTERFIGEGFDLGKGVCLGIANLIVYKTGKEETPFDNQRLFRHVNTSSSKNFSTSRLRQEQFNLYKRSQVYFTDKKTYSVDVKGEPFFTEEEEAPRTQSLSSWGTTASHNFYDEIRRVRELRNRSREGGSDSPTYVQVDTRVPRSEMEIFMTGFGDPEENN